MISRSGVFPEKNVSDAFNGYPEAIDAFMNYAKGFIGSFPKQYHSALFAGLTSLTEESHLAYSRHVAQGKETNEIINLLNGSVPAEFTGNEPLGLLRRLTLVLAYCNDVHLTHPSITAKLRFCQDGLSVYEYCYPSKNLYPGILALVRQEGARTGVPGIEYASEQGVCAGINFRMADKFGTYLPGPMPLYIEDQNKIGVISIRLEREGIDDEGNIDPVAQYGRLALDVGSVQGDGSSFEVRLGRLMALGNIEAANHVNKKTDLNHIRNELGALDGSSDTFKSVVNEWERELILRSVNSA